jgi:hypothetical protein
MIKSFYRIVQTLALVITLINQPCEEQLYSLDYEKNPYQPFNYEHLSLDLTINSDQALVSGIATYTLTPKIDGLSSIQMHTSDMAIEAVVVNNYESDFSVSGDSLLIQLSDTLRQDEEISVAITWQSTSSFGLYRDHKHNFWSSKNPLALHHWMPVFDHPRVELTFDAYFTIPNETEVMFNGEMGEVTPVSENRKKVHWFSETAIPVTGLGFVSGDFLISEMTAGFTKVRVFSSEASFSEEERQELVVETARIKKEVENYLSVEYPWEGLNVVLLPDNYWEERTHGTGTVYVYERLGSLSAQLRRGIYAQWFGEYIRGEQYLNLDNEGSNELLVTALHYALEDSSLLIGNPDSLFKVEYWNSWQNGYPAETELFTTTIERSLTELIKTEKGITDFKRFADFWYELTGIPWFTPAPVTVSTPSNAPTATYLVDVLYDETNSNLTILFDLQEGSGETLFSANLLQAEFSGRTEQEILFTGDSDTITVNLEGVTDYVALTPEDDNVELIYEEYPLYFLLNQLRSEQPELRIQAAQLLSKHADNPDLQLALSDILSFEENAEVIAAMYSTLAVITNGATGTEEQFIAGLRNDSEAIQRASIQALRNYPGNELVKNAIRNVVLRTEQIDHFQEAVHTYERIANGEEIRSVFNRVHEKDSLGYHALTFVELSDSLQEQEEVATMIEEYVEDSYAYEIRKRALEYLYEFDLDSERWERRLEHLTEDRDPRIRFWAYETVLKYKNTSDALLFFSNSGISEFDPRNKLLIQEIVKQLAE